MPGIEFATDTASCAVHVCRHMSVHVECDQQASRPVLAFLFVFVWFVWTLPDPIGPTSTCRPCSGGERSRCRVFEPIAA
jgi:hypothetical protein